MKARHNPFGTRSIERRLAFDPILLGTDWPALMSRWRTLDQRACVIGHHGSGKTTFLDAFESQLDEPVVRFFFNRNDRGLTSTHQQRMEEGKGAVWLVDGDGHLGFRDRRAFHRASREAAGFLSARHQRRGLSVLIRLKADLALARQLLHRAHPEGAGELAGDLPERFHRVNGNLRELWLDYYDHLAAED